MASGGRDLWAGPPGGHGLCCGLWWCGWGGASERVGHLGGASGRAWPRDDRTSGRGLQEGVASGGVAGVRPLRGWGLGRVGLGKG